VARGSAFGGKVAVHRGDHLVGQLADGDAAFDGTSDDLVLDVGDVAHVGDAKAARHQPAIHHVESHHHARVAHVTEVVDGDAADVHPHVTGLQRLEVFQAAGQRVVDAQGHGSGAVVRRLLAAAAR
jgi:hypothetical protein